MVYVTHDQTEALTFADKVVVMSDGEVVQVGTPQELFEQPEHTFVGYFIGSPGMNVLSAKVSGNKANVGGNEIELGRSYRTLEVGKKIEIGIRPEFLTLTSGTEGYPITIKRVEDAGRHKIVRAELASQPISLQAGEDAEIPADAARVKIDPARVHVYADGHLVRA